MAHTSTGETIPVHVKSTDTIDTLQVMTQEHTGIRPEGPPTLVEGTMRPPPPKHAVVPRKASSVPTTQVLPKKGVYKPPPPTDKLGFPPGFSNKIHIRMCDHGAASIPEDGPAAQREEHGSTALKHMGPKAWSRGILSKASAFAEQREARAAPEDTRGRRPAQPAVGGEGKSFFFFGEDEDGCGAVLRRMSQHGV